MPHSRVYATTPPSTHVLVTGGCGFLGAHLCRRLIADGHHVTCVDNLCTGSLTNVADLLHLSRFQLIRQDVTESLDISVERIFNLACPASPYHYQQIPVDTTRICVLGALNMLELARRNDARMLQASSSVVYGASDSRSQSELDWGKVNPISRRACYNEGKRCAESLCFDYHRQHCVDIRVARIFNCYGPGMQIDDGRVVSNFAVQALGGKPLTVHGSGTQSRSFCYVDDMIDALVRLMEYPQTPSAPINLGNPHEITVFQLARLIQRIVGTAPHIAYQSRLDDDPHHRRPDIICAEQLLGWSPRTDLTQGLTRTIGSFRSKLAEQDIPDSYASRD